MYTGETERQSHLQVSDSTEGLFIPDNKHKAANIPKIFVIPWLKKFNMEVKIKTSDLDTNR